MPGGRRKASGRKARRRRDNDYALESIDIETTIADKCMYGPHEQDHCMAFAEEEAELVPASMIDTLQYKQARLSGRKRGIIETDRPLFPLILPTKGSELRLDTMAL